MRIETATDASSIVRSDMIGVISMILVFSFTRYT